MNSVTLGGDRLGSGQKQKVEMHGFERSTHDLSYIWRSTMAPGTLVPFMSEVTLPGDTFDIDLDCMIKTHPTIGPLFGTFKVQLDVFYVPMRLYISALHNNTLGIGNRMQDIRLPKVQLLAKQLKSTTQDIDNFQINPSCIFSYLDIRGVGLPGQDGDTGPIFRKFNAIPWLGYWEIYKNYYSNKQQEKGVVIHNAITPPANYITTLQVINSGVGTTVNKWPTPTASLPTVGEFINITFTSLPVLDEIILITTSGELLNINLIYT